MELIKSVSKRGLIANLLHIAFNLAYVAALVLLVRVFPESPFAALGLVVISKWRIVAVRPRYWVANFLSNLTDLLFGLGITLIMWMVGEVIVACLFVAMLYAAWLIMLKPMHKHTAILLQAGISQFVALAALFAISHLLPLPVLLLICFVIGFASARHIFGTHEEDQATLLALVWGLMVVELGFVGWHWTIGYGIADAFELSQMAIIISVLGFVAERAYDSFKHHDKVRWQDVQWPVLFATVLIGLLLFLFSGLGSASQL
jgi:hypothetical protein